MVRVLIVDDSEAIRTTVSDILKQSYPELIIMFAGNGIEGVSLAENEQPDLILLDWSMPYMDGLLMAQRLRTSPTTQHIPLIAMTAEQDREEISDQLRELCASLLLKPFNVDDLINSLRHIDNLALDASE